MDGRMTGQLFEDYRKASESMLGMQRDALKHWQQFLLSAQPGAGQRGEWDKTLQKHWRELTIDMLNKQREYVDLTYRTGNELIEQALRTSEAKSPGEYRQMMEDISRKSIATLKEKSESQLRTFFGLADKVFDLGRKAATV
jgi:hypothetical protein